MQASGKVIDLRAFPYLRAGPLALGDLHIVVIVRRGPARNRMQPNCCLRAAAKNLLFLLGWVTGDRNVFRILLAATCPARVVAIDMPHHAARLVFSLSLRFPQSARGNRAIAVTQLLQNLEFFGKRKRDQPFPPVFIRIRVHRYSFRYLRSNFSHF